METINYLIDLFLHLDDHLSIIIGTYGAWVYLLLFLVILVETGLVIMPFLPGDSLLFAAGTFAAHGGPLHIGILFPLLALAAIMGDTANYWIGHSIGPRVFNENIRFVKREHLDRTRAFYEKHGGKTIILARFIPIIRTFAPFVAGVGVMNYRRFIIFNVAGGIAWTALFSFGGFFFGNLPVVRNNFEIVILAIIFISVLPAIIEYLRSRKPRPVPDPSGD